MPLIPFATKSVHQQYSGQRLLNYFPRATPDAVSPVVLIGRSPLTEKVQVGNRVHRMVKMGGAVYAVAAGAVWKFDGTSVTRVGAVVDGSQVSVAASGTEVAIVVGNTYYICNGVSTTSYSTGAVTNPQWVVFQDGYFLVSGTASGRSDALTISGLDDGTTFDSLEFIFAENAPDEVLGLVSDHGQVWAFGRDTTEVFWNSGGQDFPFQPNRSAMIEKGCINGMTVAKEDNSVLWVGPDKVVYRSGGGTPQVISTREVEEALTAKTVESGFVFQDRGHKFYAVRTDDGPTWCYDLTTGEWAERSTGVNEDPWVATDTEWLNGTQYFATSTGKISTDGGNSYTDDGEIIVGEAISRPIYVNSGEDYVFLRSLSVSVVSANASLSYTPQISLQMSRDGSVWSMEKWRDLPVDGEYEKDIRWHGIGAFRKRVQARFRVTDPVKRDLHGLAYA